MSQFILPSRATDANDNPLPGALLYFYLSGSLTPTPVYIDDDLTLPHANPVVANAGGLFPAIYTNQGILYRAILKSAGGVTIDEYDPYGPTDLISSAKGYGAIGNGVANDTTALQAAINANAGKTLTIPKGSYKLTASLKITSALTIDFEHGATLLLATPGMNGIEIGDGTEATRNATFGTVINRPAFNPFPGVAVFTPSSCIYRHYVAFCDVNDLVVYGRDGIVTKLYNGVYDYRAQDCDTPNVIIQFVTNNAVHCKGDGTIPGRTVGCNYDNLRATDFTKGVFIDEGCAGLGFYRPTIYGIKDGGWAVHINCTPGPSGQNFFFDTVDLEAQPLAAGAIWLERGSKAMFNAGWVGASMNHGLKIGTDFDSAICTADMNQSKVLIEGPHNTFGPCDVAGDIVTMADAITIKGAYTVIASGTKIRQWAGSGIAWGGSTPAGVLIGAPSFAANGTDIASLTGFLPQNAPVIHQGNTDKGRTGTAAATLALPISVPFMQVTGATTIATIPPRGNGAAVTLQAGAGGITLSNTGNIVLPASPLAVAAFQAVSLVSDGVNYFKTV